MVDAHHPFPKDLRVRDRLAPRARGYTRSGKYGTCRICGRPIQRPPVYVRERGSGQTAILISGPVEEQEHLEPVGSECARFFPKEYLTRSKAEDAKHESLRRE